MTRTPNIAERRLYHDLWYKRDWIYRRIDEIDIIKQDQFTIKSTFDLDIAYLREKLSIKEQDKSHRKQIALPLTPLLRFPILDIDVDLNGVPQSLAGSLTSASITRCILLQDIEDIFELNYDSRKWLSSILYQWLISGDVEVLKDANDELEVELRYCRKSANNEIPANEAYSAAGETWFGWWLVEHYLPYHVNCPDGCVSGEPARGRKDPPYFQMGYGSLDHIPDLVDPLVESPLPA